MLQWHQVVKHHLSRCSFKAKFLTLLTPLSWSMSVAVLESIVLISKLLFLQQPIIKFSPPSAPKSLNQFEWEESKGLTLCILNRSLCSACIACLTEVTPITRSKFLFKITVWEVSPSIYSSNKFINASNITSMLKNNGIKKWFVWYCHCINNI